MAGSLIKSVMSRIRVRGVLASKGCLIICMRSEVMEAVGKFL
jgi:hypothetical protein